MKTYTLQKTKAGQYLITIPAPIVEGKGWSIGTELMYRFGSKGEVILEESKER